MSLDANAEIYASDNADEVSIYFTIRTMEDHYFENSFSYTIADSSSFVDAELSVSLSVQVDSMLPVELSFEKNHLFQNGLVFGKFTSLWHFLIDYLGFKLNFGDFRSVVGIQSFHTGVQTSTGDVELTVIVDDKRATFGIADITQQPFSEDSFKSGIRLYFIDPYLIDFNYGKIALDLNYDQNSFGLQVENAVGLSAELEKDSFVFTLDNYLEGVVPVGKLQVSLAPGELSAVFDSESLAYSGSLAYTDTSGISNFVHFVPQFVISF